MFLITGPTYPECVTEKLVKLVSLSLTQYTVSQSPLKMISLWILIVFIINSVNACNKAENPFEKKIPIFKLNTENYGLRDFYDCSELHKGSFSFKID